MQEKAAMDMVLKVLTESDSLANSLKSLRLGEVDSESTEAVFNFIQKASNLELINAADSFMDMELSGMQCMVENLFSANA